MGFSLNPSRQFFWPMIAMLSLAVPAVCQSVSAPVVPQTIKYDGVDVTHARESVDVVFRIYSTMNGDEPLWSETQKVSVGSGGKFSVFLGADTPGGLPQTVFAAGQARWLGIRIAASPEQERVPLVSVGYAMKAADAETLGGLPPSAFMRIDSSGAVAVDGAHTTGAGSQLNLLQLRGVTGSGTPGYLPVWTGTSSVSNSLMFQIGGQVGVGTKTPGAMLDVAGSATAARGTSSGTAQGSAGISGVASAGTGQVYGVRGSTNSTTDGAAGVNGHAGGSTGFVNGVSGSSASPNGAGVWGSAPTYGVNGSATATTGITTGTSGSTASVSDGSNGVFGIATAASGGTFGVQGFSLSPNGIGVQGGSPGVGVVGVNQTCSGGNCTIQAGIAGRFSTATGGTILQGLSGSSFANLKSVFTVDSSGNGYYAGNLNVTGKLTKGSGSFKIDHPLDPVNKYLSHSFVESPDMMNVYNGNIITDKHGLATVVLPDYFEALNRDFRYQLTVIGQFAQAIVATEISQNRFVIRTNKPGVKVSWQVTGIRQDAYANANRIPVDEDKPTEERGLYLHPEVFGQPASKSVSAGVRTAANPDSVHAGTQ